MLEVVSDLLWLIEAIQASKDNWNDAHWRLHVKQIKLRLIWKSVVRFDKMLSSFKSIIEKKSTLHGIKHCGIIICCIAFYDLFHVGEAADLMQTLLNVQMFGIDDGITIMDPWNDMIPANVESLVFELDNWGLANDNLEVGVNDDNNGIITIFWNRINLEGTIITKVRADSLPILK